MTKLPPSLTSVLSPFYTAANFIHLFISLDHTFFFWPLCHIPQYRHCLDFHSPAPPPHHILVSALQCILPQSFNLCTLDHLPPQEHDTFQVLILSGSEAVQIYAKQQVNCLPLPASVSAPNWGILRICERSIEGPSPSCTLLLAFILLLHCQLS